MTTSVTLPALGESVTEGTVTRWLKQPGEQVQADEPLLEVSTDKVDTEIPAPASGTLLEIKVAEDETVEVGTELAVIGEPSEGDGAAPQPKRLSRSRLSRHPRSRPSRHPRSRPSRHPRSRPSRRRQRQRHPRSARRSRCPRWARA